MELEITQADREASWPFAPDHVRHDTTPGAKIRWLAGEHDAALAIQAFARHRLRTPSPDIARVEAEASYDAPGGSFYRSMDESGSPESAGSEAKQWIDGQAEEAKAKFDPASLLIEQHNVDGGGSVTILYASSRPIAVATIFRDAMNFSVLVKWPGDFRAARAALSHNGEAVHD